VFLLLICCPSCKWRGCAWPGDGPERHHDHLVTHFNPMTLSSTYLPAFLLVYPACLAGGVAVSGLEMAQNATMTTWSPKDVDERLKHSCQRTCLCAFACLSCLSCRWLGCVWVGHDASRHNDHMVTHINRRGWYSSIVLLLVLVSACLAGGAAVSGLEMAHNATMTTW
jgi:hypothetical protein